jgi:hypothetical protein
MIRRWRAVLVALMTPRTCMLVVAAALGLAWAGVLASPVGAAGRLGPPTVIAAGIYGGVDYAQYDGVFAGRTSTGPYRVPYRITAPTDPARGNHIVVVEPPHIVNALDGLDLNFGRAFLLGRGFSHAGVGYSTTGFGEGFESRILDPTVPGVFIEGGFEDEGGRTDDEIITDFARALAASSEAQAIVGRVERRYAVGYSDSSAPIMRLIDSGAANRVFDLAVPFTTGGTDPQAAIADGRYSGKLVIVNSEGEGASSMLVDRGVAPGSYRFYAVAGTPHLPDYLVPYPLGNMTSPASFLPELRAHFLQGHIWATRGTAPPASTHLLTTDGETLARDANGNTISVDATGRRVPRLPSVELGEAHFFTDEFGFLGIYDTVRTISELGLAPHRRYVTAFEDKLRNYANAGSILPEDADAMRRRAALCPPLTFTQAYRSQYDNFVAINPCGR